MARTQSCWDMGEREPFLRPRTDILTPVKRLLNEGKLITKGIVIGTEPELLMVEDSQKSIWSVPCKTIEYDLTGHVVSVFATERGFEVYDVLAPLYRDNRREYR